jgi:hypothetical protein
MIAIDPIKEILYGKSGQSEVWIWWVSRGEVGEFALTTRRSNGAIETTWLGSVIGQESLDKNWEQADTDVSPAEGAHGIGSYDDGTAYVWHRKGDFAYTIRLVDNPELYMAWKMYNLSVTKMKVGLLGWAY